MTDNQRKRMLRYMASYIKEDPMRAHALAVRKGLISADTPLPELTDMVMANETQRLQAIQVSTEKHNVESERMETIWREATALQHEAVDTGWPPVTDAVVIDRCRNRHMVRIRLADEREALMWRGRLRWPIGAPARVKMSEYREDAPIYEAVKEWDAAAVV